MSQFVHLHCHTEFSLLDGLSKIPDLLERAHDHGQEAIAITDHGAMHGAVHFYNKAKEKGMKPIIGIETYVAANSRFDKQAKMGSDQFHLLLLAKNFTGYQNLMRLASIANLEGFSYRPRIDFEVLSQYHEGIICTSGCLASQFSQLLMKDKRDEAIELFKKYHALFGDDFYIEVQSHEGNKEVKEVGDQMIAISRELGIPLVATNDVHYVNSDDAAAQDALLCIQTRRMIEDKERMKMQGTDYYLKSTQEMEALFAHVPDALENTVKIAEKCNVEIPLGNVIFPHFEIPEGETTESYTRKLAFERLEKYYPGVSSYIETVGKAGEGDAKELRSVASRLNYEIEVIRSKGYLTYFLIVQDFVNWAKDSGIFVGPGRGSAAGSLLSFSLNITSIDPLIHILPFERFMNPERESTPDIDIDFADTRREEVIQYVTKKYGADKVAQIITFGRMESRAAVRDIGRVLGLSFSDTDKIAKLIPDPIQGHVVHIKDAIATVPLLQEYHQQPKYKQLLDLAMKVEGSARHTSVHAAGVIIADKPLTEYTPIQKDSKSGKVVTQYDMKVLDLNISPTAIGLMKMDFLGLRNLSILQEAIKIVKNVKDIDIDLSTIPLDDKKVYDMIRSGETTGVFQMESGGMRKLARNLKPSVFSDLTAMVALYRPGPMALIDDFVASKNNPASIKYPHKNLEWVLKDTYGILLYQEQCLQVANVMAGFTMGQADELRRAIGKKKMEIMIAEKEKFSKGALNLGYDKKTIDQVWGFIEKFSGYGFGRAHSAGYAMIAYQTAYMKVNFPNEYMCAMLSIESNSTGANRDQKIAQGVNECRRLKILILTPDINKSDENFSIEPNEHSLNGFAIRFGLTAVKNVGSAAIESVITSRAKGGEFISFTDFLQRTDSRKINKKVLESLIRVGAMDRFGTRASMLDQLEEIRTQAGAIGQQEGQDSLFQTVGNDSSHKAKDNFKQLPEYPQAELLSFEKELLGFYLTQHPMAEALEQVSKMVSHKIDELEPTIHDKKTATLGGIITALRAVKTKVKQEDMCFGTLDDGSGTIEFVLFPRAHKEFTKIVTVDAVVLMKGTLSLREDKLSLQVEKVREPEVGPSINENPGNILSIPRGTSKETLQDIGKYLKSRPGDDELTVIVPNGAVDTQMKLPYTLKWDDETKTKVQLMLKGALKREVKL